MIFSEAYNDAACDDQSLRHPVFLHCKLRIHPGRLSSMDGGCSEWQLALELLIEMGVGSSEWQLAAGLLSGKPV